MAHSENGGAGYIEASGGGGMMQQTINMFEKASLNTELKGEGFMS